MPDIRNTNRRAWADVDTSSPSSFATANRCVGAYLIRGLVTVPVALVGGAISVV